jgi:hypothetical protein
MRSGGEDIEESATRGSCAQRERCLRERGRGISLDASSLSSSSSSLDAFGHGLGKGNCTDAPFYATVIPFPLDGGLKGGPSTRHPAGGGGGGGALFKLQLETRERVHTNEAKSKRCRASPT